MKINQLKTIKRKPPRSAVVAITYRCNSRCRMCGIWRRPSSDELKPADYLKLPASLDDINITGGEPFLRDDLLEILDNVFLACNPERVVISSNGFLTERIVQLVKELSRRPYAQRVALAFSLDGLGKAHDQIRGVAGAYTLVTKTISRLKEMGFNNIGLGFTFLAGNEGQFRDVFELAEKNELNFGATIVHNAENYFAISENPRPNHETIARQTDYFIKKKISSLKISELGKCYYMHGLSYYARFGKTLVPCAAMRDSFFLDPLGDIYPCNILADRAGNLLENDFNDIWHGAAAEKIRVKTGHCPNPCWMVCTAKPGIKKHWLKTGWWLASRKLFYKL